MKKDKKLLCETDICPDLSELMGWDDIPMIIVKKEDKKSGTDDSVGNDKTTVQD